MKFQNFPECNPWFAVIFNGFFWLCIYCEQEKILSLSVFRLTRAWVVPAVMHVLRCTACWPGE
ncbi:hypothetical protein DLM_3343 [Aquitalea magnusonii]|uniref:Uncharacterized protein n=1 Tax=Aquitalea magnusonii TaxID=332411 RepID=A0A3G9GHJ2_9NEIS|nr:hypothetical protein DLM_3343 [Aquitalea magnusonii]